jgi:uncharacterized protein with PQ loop repeat
MPGLYEIIGYAGTLLAVVAYLPQIIHLMKEHCSAGISLPTYWLWVASSLCVLIYSISIQSVVIMVMQIANLLAILTILIFAKKYQGLVCPTHQ